MPATIALPSGALQRLCRAEPGLAAVVDRVGPFTLTPGLADSALESLVRSVVFQQLSGKAATTIFLRLRALFPPGPFPGAAALAAASDEALRGCGLSRQKLSYLRSLCEQIALGSLDPEGLASLGDDEVIERLTRVKGFGRWSAQMFLIFHLGRLDVWPHDDLGVRKGLGRVQGLADAPSSAVVRAQGERFRPYRTVAAWYLWRAAEGPG